MLEARFDRKIVAEARRTFVSDYADDEPHTGTFFDANVNTQMDRATSPVDVSDA
jgi:hypothetical protein